MGRQVLAAIRELYDLQALDLDLDRCRQRLGVIADALGDDGYLVTLRGKARDVAAAVNDAVAQQNELDLGIAGFNERIAQAESKMYGGTVSSPRELSDLQAEVAQHHRQRSQLEDRLLTLLDQLDRLRVEMQSATTQLQQGEQQWEEEQTAMAEEKVTLENVVADASSGRAIKAGSVSPAELALYDQVRRIHHGKAVARVDRGMCEACRVGLPTSQVQALRTATAPIRCGNCGLILLAE
jgi:predicted  nucleic acid-binding Zn-ribbon protein